MAIKYLRISKLPSINNIPAESLKDGGEGFRQHVQSPLDLMYHNVIILE